MFLKEKNGLPTRVLVYESVGFLAIIILCWLDEWLSFTSLLLHGNAYLADFRQSAVKMLLVLAVWFIVTRSTRRLLNRLRYLEAFMRVCAWCHRIHFKGRWMPMEEFFQQGFDTPTTHGICPHCLERNKAGFERARKARSETAPPAATHPAQTCDPEPATQHIGSENCSK